MYSEDPKYLLYCTVANITLLSTLGNNGILDSDYYNNLVWPWEDGNPNVGIIKDILKQVKFGNPAMMLMQFYALLVMPMQLTPDYNDFCKTSFNGLFDELKRDVNTTYKSDERKINYYKHVRNAISHSNFKFLHNEKCVEFCDKDKKGHNFNTIITYDNAAILLEHLCGKMMDYLNQHKQ